ncbi:aminotransferase class I/II-fold pyridoxal phosphate-dependent enzyme [Altererythrobacter xixiisoli]|uniref:Aminotransferase class I/II-fold pyridoxal phosphate-dependent enzyme n=1 Tax=Croceibacterium xixiisoli TaxID=1476466 RepID=A0A6I4TXN7_9SPHN|nr:aromatic amino acid transaminase [Croceibacterium xixiisoli]MXP00936.1 aminotransferase class I/II-fold pyridoxal phosphate-dependent enzyme [Croceibacterium xixiisoli]
MLDRLDQQPPDALLALIKLHDADSRADKIDLGVGVYRTDDGATPVFASIKAAERKLVAEQDSKAYLGPEGDMGFVHALVPFIFGADSPLTSRIEGMQTPGGTGAVRLALALARRAGVTRVFMGTPSWPNHAQIVADLGMELVGFRHAAPDGTADLDALKTALANARDGDAVLLHGCCHNPTGIDFSEAQWDEIASLLAASPVLPIIDLAYQGLGKGMDEDAYGTRTVLAAVPQALIAYSCDKNFGLYRDRVGALYVMAPDAGDLNRILSNGHALARAAWSMPPDHGAAAVRLVLEDAELTANWLAELQDMRSRIGQVRAALAEAGLAGSVDLTPYGRQFGMFAMLPLDKLQIDTLRSDHGIYMAATGRINVAGLTMDNLPKFIGAIAAVSDPSEG